MDDLVEFLRARLEEDEIAAKAAAWIPGKDWKADVQGPGRERDGVLWDQDGTMVIAWFDDHLDCARLPALFDPRRVLREVEAKRGAVDMHEDCGSGAGYCDDGGHGIDGIGCPDLLLLAAVYRDHPDYDPAWAG